jgi:hypothetical protein
MMGKSKGKLVDPTPIEKLEEKVSFMIMSQNIAIYLRQKRTVYYLTRELIVPF